MNSQRYMPNRKIGAAAGLGTPLAVILVYIINLTLGDAGPIPGEVAGALSALMAALVGYLVPERVPYSTPPPTLRENNERGER